MGGHAPFVLLWRTPAVCGEDKVISDACRAGKSDVDRTLCEDKQLHAAQAGVSEEIRSS
jgi:hypothetical protein